MTCAPSKYCFRCETKLFYFHKIFKKNERYSGSAPVELVPYAQYLLIKSTVKNCDMLISLLIRVLAGRIMNAIRCALAQLSSNDMHSKYTE